MSNNPEIDNTTNGIPIHHIEITERMDDLIKQTANRVAYDMVVTDIFEDNELSDNRVSDNRLCREFYPPHIFALLSPTKCANLLWNVKDNVQKLQIEWGRSKKNVGEPFFSYTFHTKYFCHFKNQII